MGASATRLASMSRIWALGAALCGALPLAACATGAPQQTSTDIPSGAPDGGYTMAPPSTPAPSKKGVIVPGDPSSGTAGLGSGSGSLPSSTGTTGTRINPGGGSSDGK